MKEIYRASVNPQQKMVAVNNKFGNTDIKFQQGTSRTIYDTLEWSAAGQTLRFFEDSSSRNFPLSNTGSDGNKLGVGETFVIESVTLLLSTFDPASRRFTNTFSPAAGTSAANAGVGLGILNFEIANQKVIKNLALTELFSEVNGETGAEASFATLYLDTAIVIPPLLNYVLEIRTAPCSTAPSENIYMRAILNGPAGIIAPRTTF
jgi:hypothetical protein